MSYDSGYPNEPIGGGNPYYRCVFCKLSDPQINGNINKHAFYCKYRQEKQGFKLTYEQYEDLLDEVHREDLQVYTSVQLAWRALDSDDIARALLHLKIDADKLRMVSKKLYDIVLAQNS